MAVNHAGEKNPVLCLFDRVMVDSSQHGHTAGFSHEAVRRVWITGWARQAVELQVNCKESDHGTAVPGARDCVT